MLLHKMLEESPDIPFYGGGKWAIYSIGCCWWTTFPEDLGHLHDFRVEWERTDENDLPCCPHCGSVLMQAPLDKFLESAKANPEHYGEHKLWSLEMAHSRNTGRCWKRWDDYFDFLPSGDPRPHRFA